MSYTYYSSLSGMLAASFGLQDTSHNVANMQSPGFKRSDVFYSSLGQSRARGYEGCGVAVRGQTTNFSAGKYFETANPTDLAIVGQGFFIVRLPSNELMYTRDGEFGLNEEGLLIDKHSQGLIMGYDQQKRLIPISGKGPAHSPGQSTHRIELKGDLVSIPIQESANEPPNPDPEKSNYELIRFTIDNIFDDQGKTHQITLELKAPGSIFSKEYQDQNWQLENISCDSAEIDWDKNSTLEFNASNGVGGEVKTGKNSLHLTLNHHQQIILDFGSYEKGADYSVQLNKKSSLKTTSAISAYQQDGFGPGKQIDFHFDENGFIIYGYENGKKITGLPLALAHFNNREQDLIQANDNLFRALSTTERFIATANHEGLGTIRPQQLESANVDSTMEFAHIVVLQRMFQACSQLMDIDKQLLEEMVRK